MPEERELTQEEIAANVAKTNAETAKLLAEAREATAKACKAECDAEKAAISLRESKFLERVESSSDVHFGRYYFGSQVDSASVRKCIDTLTFLHRDKPGSPIEIIFNSPGGSVIPGMELFDYIRWLSAEGHHVTTTAMGYAASMGGILLQAGDRRVMGREAWVLIHEISAATGGKIGDMKDDVAFYDHLCDRVVDIFTNRSGGKLSKTVMRKNWTRKDWWIDSDQALKLGIVDKVR